MIIIIAFLSILLKSHVKCNWILLLTILRHVDSVSLDGGISNTS